LEDALDRVGELLVVLGDLVDHVEQRRRQLGVDLAGEVVGQAVALVDEPAPLDDPGAAGCRSRWSGRGVRLSSFIGMNLIYDTGRSFGSNRENRLRRPGQERKPLPPGSPCLS